MIQRWEEQKRIGMPQGRIIEDVIGAAVVDYFGVFDGQVRKATGV